MTILFTGKTDFKYNRVRILLMGLEKCSHIQVLIYPFKNRNDFDVTAFKTLEEKADYIYIPPFRHRDVSFIKSLSKKPVIFDPLISKYLTKAIDYGHFWKAPFKYFLDKKPFTLADILLTDTLAHKEYFIKKFKLKPAKVHVLPIGVDTSKFYASADNLSKTKNTFRVGFYGSFVPLQGVSKIIEAAKLLENENDIVFDIIGTGYEYEKTLKQAKKLQLKNVNFIGWVNYDELNKHLNNFDVCLGIFGSSAKADAVIPNKIYHYASIGKCFITKDTPGIKEIFTHNKNAILCANTPFALAENIISLKKHQERISTIGQNAATLINEQYNEMAIAQHFLSILENN